MGYLSTVYLCKEYIRKFARVEEKTVIYAVRKEFFHSYTKLACYHFCIAYGVKSKIISVNKFPSSTD